MSRFHPVTHVIFDLDGLLLDTEAGYEIAMKKVCNKYGTNFANEVKQKSMGRGKRGSAEAVVIALNLPISTDEFLKQFDQAITEVFEKEMAQLLPGAEKLVDHLKHHNIPFCIATGSDDFNLSVTTKNHKEFLAKFDYIVRSPHEPEVKIGKPAPDVFLLAAKRFKNPPTDMKSCLVFEDSANGVLAGNAAGMQVVWVPPADIDTSGIESTLKLTSLEEFQPELFGLPPF